MVRAMRSAEVSRPRRTWSDAIAIAFLVTEAAATLLMKLPLRSTVTVSATART